MSEYIRSLSPSLFWDVDCETLDDEKHRRFVIGRVLEQGVLQMLCLATLAPSTLGLLRRIQSLDAFADTRLVGGAELEPMPKMLAPVDWQVVTGTIEAAVRELG